MYIIKDGRLMLYLGKTKDDKFVFYTCGSVTFSKIEYFVYTVANYDIQVKYAIELCRALMKNAVYKESITLLKGVPKIHCLFPYVDFSDSYANWYIKSALAIGGLPSISTLVGKDVRKSFVDYS